MTRELFDIAYKDRTWGGSSPSGPGSSLTYTESIRDALPNLLAALKCKTLLDAPCGDINWVDSIVMRDVVYIGYDISESLIHALREKHPNRDLHCADITSDPLPKVDFWLCRDVLFHISNADIYKVLFNFLHSEINYLGTTHHAQVQETVDCESSPNSWRGVNLTLAPFYLPNPLFTIWDSAPGFPDRWLAVWSRAQVRDWLYRINGVTAAAAAFFPSQPPRLEPPPLVLHEKQKDPSMPLNFHVRPAYGPDGKPQANVSPIDHGLYEFDLHGASFSMLSLGDCQVTMAYLAGGVKNFEPFSLQIWAAIAERSNLILDIGSYTGIYSLIGASRNSQAKVIAFEASQTTFGRLMANILVNKADGQISPVHKAASNRSGHLDLALSGGIYTMASGESLEESAHTTAWARKRVETISVDEIIIDWERFHPSDLTLALPNEGVSLVKIDVEGHEKSTLSGMRRIIDRDHPTMLIEILQTAHLNEILATMDGYEGFWVGEAGVISFDHVSEGMNALLIHKTREDLKRHIADAVGVEFPA